MRLVRAVLFFIFLCNTSLFAQVENDSVQTNQIREDRLYQIQQWEEQIDKARERGDLYTEMTTLIYVINNRICDLGDNSGAYELAVYLEKLIRNNPNERASKKVEPYLSMYMGMLLRDQQKNDESLEYFKKATELTIRDSIFGFYRDASNHVGEMLSVIGKNEEALTVFKENEVKGLPMEGDSIEYLTRIYQFKAEHFLRNKLYDSTLYYAKKSIYNKVVPSQQSNRYALIAKVLLKLNGNPDSILFYAEKSLKVAQSIGAQREEIASHDLLSQAYSKSENYKKAYYHFEKFYELEQEQRSFDDALQIGNVNLEREKEAAKLQQQLADERLSNQRLVIWIVSGGLLLLIFGLYYIFNRLKLIRKQNKIIEQEKLRAEQSERYKEQFLANMSHEIRTPMHAISGMVNALRRRNHSKEQAAYLDAMKISSDNLLVILNDVLDMSKIESGSLEIAKLPIDVIEITNNVVNLLNYKAKEKGLTISFNKPKDFPKSIQGDPVRLNQILINLVGNAIKFTEEGRITINLTSEDENLRFSIQDTGIGIPEASIGTIFDSFKQGEDVLNKRYAGTGLGLSITKQLIDLQKGQIWVESKQDQGSTFYFELPLIEVEERNTTAEGFTEQHLKDIGKTLKGLKVLIAEDNSFNVMVVRDDLTWYIPEVDLTFVENGNEAIEKFKEHTYDIVLMDVQMPEMNGYEATKQIRQLELETKNKKTPIIAMTASLLKDQIDKCYDAGMNAYIPKPYKPEELLLTLKDV